MLALNPQPLSMASVSLLTMLSGQTQGERAARQARYQHQQELAAAKRAAEEARRRAKTKQEREALNRDRQGRALATAHGSPLRRYAGKLSLRYRDVAIVFQSNRKLYLRRSSQRFARRITTWTAPALLQESSNNNRLIFSDDTARSLFMRMIPVNDEVACVDMANMIASEFIGDQAIYGTLTHYLKAQWWLPEQYNEELHSEWVRAFKIKKASRWDRTAFGLPTKRWAIDNIDPAPFNAALRQIRSYPQHLSLVRRDQYDERQKFALGQITLLRNKHQSGPQPVSRGAIPLDVQLAAVS